MYEIWKEGTVWHLQGCSIRFKTKARAMAWKWACLRPGN